MIKVESIQPDWFLLDWNLMMLGLAFCVLVIATFARSGGIVLIRNRTLDDWVLDISNLIMQGVMIQWLKVVIIVASLRFLLPDWAGTLVLNPFLAFLCSFVILDYGYYWNHRCLHTQTFWPIHRVHHTARQMDVLVTSRNTLWTSFFILYLWVNSIMMYLLAEPAVYFFGFTLTAVLDLWRHSNFQPKGIAKTVLGALLILPNDHAWHHSRDRYGINFGANLNIWDKMHGTWRRDDLPPKQLGIDEPMKLVHKLWWPFK